MWLSLTKFDSITLIIIIVPPTLYPLYLVFLVRLEGYIVNLCDFYFYKIIGKLTTFFQLQMFIYLNLTVSIYHFHYLFVVFFSQIKSKIDDILTKVVTLCINLILDDTPITSKSHTHTSHSETSRLLTSSQSLGMSVPRSTQCMWVV